MKKRILCLLMALALLASLTVFPTAADTTTQDEAAQAAMAKGNTIAAAAEAMTFPESGSVVKYCPACEKDVTWTAFVKGVNWFAGEQSKHRYLPEGMELSELSDSASGAAVYATLDSCLHLNGKTLTVTDAAAIRVTGGTMNIMGSGTVTGNYSGTGSSAVHVAGGATVNLYGGTYAVGTAAGASSPVIMMGSGNYGTVNIFGTTKLQAAATVRSSVPGGIYLTNDNGKINLYGGTVTGGNSNSTGGNVRVNKGSFAMHGGTISGGIVTTTTNADATGGNVYVGGGEFIMTGGSILGADSSNNKYGGNITVAGGSCTISGGTVTGGKAAFRGGNIYVTGGTFAISGGTVSAGTAVQGKNINIQTDATVSGGTFTDGDVYMANTLTLSGGPVVETLTVPAGKTFTVGTMKHGASVGVSGSGILSSNGGLQTAAQYFYGVKAEGDAVIPTKADGKLSYSPAELTLTDGVGWCAACGADVEWEMAVVNNTDGTNMTWNGNTDGMHGYLAADKNVTGVSNTWSKGAAVYAKAEVCLHLNGKNLSAANAPAIWANTEAANLSILGSGTVEGKAAANYGTCAISLTSGAAVNLYGGTYSKTADAPAISSVVVMGSGGYGNLNLYRGAVIDGENVQTSTTPGCVYIANDSGVFNMYGGSIVNGSTGSGGNMQLRKGAFNMYGGSIENGAATGNGANLALTGGTCTLYGGTISGGNAAGLGDNIFVAADVTGFKVAQSFNGTASVAYESITEPAYGMTVPGASTGDYAGSLTLEWAAGGNPNIYGVDSKLVVAGAQLVGEEVSWAVDGTAAAAAAGENEYVKLCTADALELTKDTYVDFNGQTVAVTGTGKLYGMDSTASVTKAGTASVTYTGTVAAETENPLSSDSTRYIAITENGTTTFHVVEITLTHVALKPDNAGVYYKGTYTCDDVLAGKIQSFGVVVSLNNTPGADFATETGDINRWTAFGKEEFVSGGAVSGVTITNIFSESAGGETNMQRGESPIYARAYMTVDTGNGAYTAISDNEAGHSLHSTMELIDSKWDSLPVPEADRTRALEFYKKWNEKGVSWTFQNIKAE